MNSGTIIPTAVLKIDDNAYDLTPGSVLNGVQMKPVGTFEAAKTYETAVFKDFTVKRRQQPATNTRVYDGIRMNQPDPDGDGGLYETFGEGMEVRELLVEVEVGETTKVVKLNVASIESIESVDAPANGEDEEPAAETYTAVQNPTGNPKTSGWYEKSGNEYILTNDTEVDSGKTYYTKDTA